MQEVRRLRIGVVVALPAEAVSLLGRQLAVGERLELPGGHSLKISGTGPRHARTAAEELASDCEALISWGCAGALSPDMRPGCLLVPERISGEDGDLLETDSVWRGRLLQRLSASAEIHTGLLQESSVIVAEKAEKVRIHSESGAIATDMESAAIGRVAGESGLPFLVIRSVADHQGMTLPRSVMYSLDSHGEVILPRLFRYCLSKPFDLIELVRLGLVFNASMRSLALVRKLAGSDFCIVPTVEQGDFP